MMTTTTTAHTLPERPPAPRSLPAVLATARYEYRMQVRRRSVWIVELILVGLMFVGAGPRSPLHLGAHSGLVDLAGSWALTFNILAPIGVGILLADRGRREHRLGIDDLLDATPTGIGARWWGKVFGATAASVTPIAVAWVVLLIVLAILHGPGIAPVGIAAFITVTLPGLVFVAAAALTIPLLLGSALFRIGLVGYWFWGNLLAPNHGVPTPAGTVVEPLGEYAAAGWFGGLTLTATDRGIHPNAAQAGLNVALILAASVLLLMITHFALARRHHP